MSCAWPKWLPFLTLLVLVNGTLASYNADTYSIRTETGVIKVPRKRLDLGEVSLGDVVGKLKVQVRLPASELISLNKSTTK